MNTADKHHQHIDQIARMVDYIDRRMSKLQMRKQTVLYKVNGAVKQSVVITGHHQCGDEHMPEHQYSSNPFFQRAPAVTHDKNKHGQRDKRFSNIGNLHSHQSLRLVGRLHLKVIAHKRDQKRNHEQQHHILCF